MSGCGGAILSWSIKISAGGDNLQMLKISSRSEFIEYFETR
jgi:hypothetical protein